MLQQYNIRNVITLCNLTDCFPHDILQAISPSKFEISHQCPYQLVFYYREGRETGGPEGDQMVACGYTWAYANCQGNNLDKIFSHFPKENY